MVVPSNVSNFYAPPSRTFWTRNGPTHFGESLSFISIAWALINTYHFLWSHGASPLFLYSGFRRFSFSSALFFFCIASSVLMYTVARPLTSAYVAAGNLIKDSLKGFARNPLTKAPTNISSLGLVSPVLILPKRLRNCFNDSSRRCFMSNMSTICSCFGRFIANVPRIPERKQWRM